MTRSRIFSALLAVAGLLPAALAAQTQGGAIAGSVVDAETHAPLEGALVVLAPHAGAFGTDADPFVTASRIVVTGAAGAYRFPSLSPGEYLLRVERLGYRSASVEIRLRSATDSNISVGLEVAPIALEAVSVVERSAQTYGRAIPESEPAAAGLRVRTTRFRQDRHLETDVRSLTHGEVLEAVTLGESDLFRALQRLPGVTTRDDFSAELWARGAPWDQTRIYFDGLPLHNPLHGMGLFSGIAPDGVGTAFFHPGVRPARLGPGAAAVVDLRSRRGGGGEGLRGLADLSLASARVALDESISDGRGAWMVAGRRSYIDWLLSGIERAFDAEDASLPYSFWDVTARFDHELGGDRAIEASALWEQDRIRGDIPDVIHRTTARWGNAAARVTLTDATGPFHARYTLGASRYAARVRPGLPDSALEDRFSAPAEPPADNVLDYVTLRAELEPAGTWSAGGELAYHAASYVGPRPIAYVRERLGAGDLALDEALPMLALWGDYDWRLGDLTVRTGLRAEAGPAIVDAAALRLAPRVSARLRLGEDAALSAGVGRSYQYTQALAPTGPNVELAAASWVWLMAGDEVPALRSDIATAGAEAWLGSRWLAAVNVYVRHGRDMAIPDPAPGPLADRPLFVLAGNDARGIELSLRKLAGRWTSSLAYSYTRSDLEAAGLRFPAPAERRHSLDGTVLGRVTDRIRLGAGFTAASGAAYQRITSCELAPECQDGPDRLGEPGANRGRAYASIDLLFDWSRPTDWGELGVYLQLRNATNHDNAVTYKESVASCGAAGVHYTGGGAFCIVGPDGNMVPAGITDEFMTALPILPVLGFRAAF